MRGFKLSPSAARMDGWMVDVVYSDAQIAQLGDIRHSCKTQEMFLGTARSR